MMLVNRQKKSLTNIERYMCLVSTLW